MKIAVTELLIIGMMIAADGVVVEEMMMVEMMAMMEVVVITLEVVAMTGSGRNDSRSSK